MEGGNSGVEKKEMLKKDVVEVMIQSKLVMDGKYVNPHI